MRHIKEIIMKEETFRKLPTLYQVRNKCAVIRCGKPKIRGYDGMCLDHWKKVNNPIVTTKGIAKIV